MKRGLGLVALVLAGCPPLVGQAALGAFVRAVRARGGEVGVLVVEVGTGRIVAAHGPDRPRVPASNMKLLTAAAALLWLGAEHPFRTRLWAADAVVAGELRGALYLSGDGDPFFGAPGEAGPAAFAAAVRRAGIRRVAGGIRLVEERLDRSYRHPDWEDYPLGVAPPVAALGLGANRIRVRLDGRGVHLEPPFAPVGRVRRRFAPGSLRIRWTPRGELVVTGPRRPRRRLRASLPHPDPPALVGAALGAALRARGVVVAGGVGRAAAVPAGARLLAEHRVPLRRLLGPCLRASRNRLAELLFKAAGAAYTDGPGSFAAGAAALRALLARAGVAAGGAVIRDGSGLSRRNRLTPRQLVGLLRWLVEQPFWETLAAALPAGGQTGTTLARRFRGPAWRGRLRAKTGYLAGVHALSGYLRVGPRRLWAFSVLLQGGGSGARARLDRFLGRLLQEAGSSPRRRSRGRG